MKERELLTSQETGQGIRGTARGLKETRGENGKEGPRK